MLKAFPADTSLEAARVQFSLLRRLSTERRLEMVFTLSNGLRATVAAGVRRRHPDYSAEKVKWAVLRLTLGQKLFARCFPGVEVRP